MKVARLVILAVSFLLLGGGYLCSIINYNSEQRPAYYERIDQQPIVLVSLLLLITAIGIGFVPRRGED